jgi:phosphoribosylglycinamide formyltransferase-1
MQIAVLASGTGSLLQTLLDTDLPVAVVLVDRHCRAEEIAANAGVPVLTVVRKDFSPSFDRNGFTHELLEALAPFDVDLIVMAGFGTILGAPAHEAYPSRILNTHPALLPAFKGWHAVPDALAAGVKVSGCTVHVAELAVDEGVILAQEAVPVLVDDTVESLHERIKVVERRLYPEAIRAALAVLEQGGSLA